MRLRPRISWRCGPAQVGRRDSAECPAAALPPPMRPVVAPFGCACTARHMVDAHARPPLGCACACLRCMDAGTFIEVTGHTSLKMFSRGHHSAGTGWHMRSPHTAARPHQLCRDGRMMQALLRRGSHTGIVWHVSAQTSTRAYASAVACTDCGGRVGIAAGGAPAWGRGRMGCTGLPCRGAVLASSRRAGYGATGHACCGCGSESCRPLFNCSTTSRDSSRRCGIGE